MVQALVAAAQSHHDAGTQPVVFGPSNIGNYFAAHGIDATCGYGVSHEAVHGHPTRAAAR